MSEHTYNGEGMDRPEVGEANAAFIVRACNSFDALVEALEKLTDQYIHMSDGHAETEARVVNARNVLAQAKQP
jgi:hypothetical protein